MYTRVTKANFRDTFLTSAYSENFSYSGLTALYDYFSELEDELNESIEFDYISIAGEYSELTIEELRDNYSINKDIDVIKYLQENTIVIEIENSDSVIIQDY
jgi:cobyrinic acid a,c-diamide synthase